MNLKKYLEARVRGWLPKEPDSPGFCRTSDRENTRIRIRETSTFRYLMFFVIAVFLRLVSLPFLSRTEIVDIPLVLVAIAAGAALIAVICETRTGHTSKWTKLSSRAAVDLGLGFIIYAVGATFVYLMNQAVQGTLLLLVIFSYIAVFIIDVTVSKKMPLEWLSRS
jgi:hypothetical protein